MTTIFTSPFPDVDIPDVTLHQLIRLRAIEQGDAPALVDATTDRVVTYRELVSSVDKVASGLVARGLSHGDVVAIVAANCIEYPIAALGVLSGGGVITGMNPSYTSGEISHQLADSGATRVITIPQLLDTVLEATAEAGIEEVFVIGGAEGATAFEALLDHDLAPVEVEVDPGDLASLPYSSGTTGRSKGVRLTHRNLVANIAQADAALPIEPGDRVLAFLPMFHIFGFTIVTMCGLASGAKLVTVPGFDPAQFCETIQSHAINKLFVVPPVLNFLAAHPLVDNYDMSSVELIGCGAAPLGAEMETRAAERLNCVVGQGFGMTEVSGAASLVVLGSTPAGSSGAILSNMQAKIVDPETGEALGPNETGELWVTGPNVFSGYLNNDEATAETLDGDGWLHSGDLGHFDGDGQLFVTDRLKELIKVKGFQVAPAELEALLMTHPNVADVAVVGRADERSGEVPVAHVVPAGDLDVEELKAFVAERAADYKQLADVIVTDAIPKNPSGKILRRLLR